MAAIDRAITAESHLHRFATISMDTWVTIQVVSGESRRQIQVAVDRALAWFDEVERACSRFDPISEVSRLGQTVGRPVKVSRLLLEALDFALELARITRGAFDPTVGAALERRGFDHDYRTGAHVRSNLDRVGVSYCDVRVDRATGTVTLRQPALLDLGAVVKGLAIDLAAHELRMYENVSVDAGGDLYARGHNALSQPWRVGIQHPRAEGLIARTLIVANGAVCTSGDYERHLEDGDHHILDPRTGSSPRGIASVSVMAPTAMAADGLSTAAMLLGPDQGLALLEAHGVEGLMLMEDGRTVATTGGFGEAL